MKYEGGKLQKVKKKVLRLIFNVRRSVDVSKTELHIMATVHSLAV